MPIARTHADVQHGLRLGQPEWARAGPGIAGHCVMATATVAATKTSATVDACDGALHHALPDGFGDARLFRVRAVPEPIAEPQALRWMECELEHARASHQTDGDGTRNAMLDRATMTARRRRRLRANPL